MNRYPALTLEQINSRLNVDLETGICTWKYAGKFRPNAVGKVAGGIKKGVWKDKSYWVISIGGLDYRRSQIVLTVASGKYPEETVDHIDGNSLNDAASNLRHATITQNAWNRNPIAKKSTLPMGVKKLRSGRFMARITVHGRSITIGTFDTTEQASVAYQIARKENYGAFC